MKISSSENSTTFNFQNLPSNIIEQILSFLEFADLISLRSLSKALANRLRNLRIVWKVPVTVHTAWNQLESKLDDQVKEVESFRKFVDEVVACEFWTVSQVKIIYKLHGNDVGMRKRIVDSPCSFTLDDSVMKMMEAAFKEANIHLKVVIRDSRMILYQGEPLKLRVNFTDLLVSSQKLVRFDVAIHPSSPGLSCHCVLDDVVTEQKTSSVERFSANNSPLLTCNISFLRQLTRLCSSLVSVKAPKLLESLDYM